MSWVSEKPAKPKSKMVPIGAYLFRPSVFDIVQQLQPSARGEFEITDVLNEYIRRGTLISCEFAGQWHDAGTVASLLSSSSFAASFAPGLPSRAGERIADVAAEEVDPSKVRPGE